MLLKCTLKLDMCGKSQCYKTLYGRRRGTATLGIHRVKLIKGYPEVVLRSVRGHPDWSNEPLFLSSLPAEDNFLDRLAKACWLKRLLQPLACILRSDHLRNLRQSSGPPAPLK